MNDMLNKKQNNKMTVFAIMLSIISIGLLIFGFTLVSSDKVVMLQSISNLSSKLDNILDNNGSLFDKIANSNDIGIRSNIRLKSDDIDSSLSIDYLENKKDKKSKLLLDVLVNDENLLGLDLSLMEEQLHFFVDDITPSYYSTALEYTSFISSLSRSDYDKLISLLKEAVTDYIDNEEIEKRKVEIIYNGKDKKVNKLTYKITNLTIIDIATNFINSVKKDKKLLEHIASYTNITKKELINEFDEVVKSLKDSEEKIEYNYHVYYYGFNKIVQYELEDINTKTVFTYKMDDKEIINLYQEDINYLSLEITNKKNKYNFNGFILNDNDEKYLFSGNIKDNTLTFILDYDVTDIKLVMTSLTEEKENNFIFNNSITLSTIVDKEETKLGSIEFNNEYYFNQKVNIDVTDSVNIDEITEDDINTIKNNIMNHPIYLSIISIIENANISL